MPMTMKCEPYNSGLLVHSSTTVLPLLTHFSLPVVDIVSFLLFSYGTSSGKI
jgi:hypothetical protein